MNLPKRSKVNLPKGWIVVNSTSHPDRVYYFNVHTRESSWTEPRQEQNKPKPANVSQKRKLSAENEKDDVPGEKFRPTTPPKPSNRRKIRAKRRSETSKVQETPQMKEMRQKILDKKQSKSSQNEKQKSSGFVSENNNKNASSSVAGKPNRNGKPTPLRNSSKFKTGGPNLGKLVNGDLDLRSTSGSSSSTSFAKSTTTISSNSTKNSRKNEQRTDSSKSSSSSSRNSTLNKNLASKRLDSLKRTLNTERKKIEPTITAKVARRMLAQDSETKKLNISADSNANSKLRGAKTPARASESLPSISQNAESRFKSLRAKLITNSASSSVQSTKENTQTDEVAVQAPKVVKPNKRLAKEAAKASFVNAEPSILDRRDESIGRNDSFWEAMDWEPIEEEKVVVQIQEVRMQLSTDQGTAQQKCPDYTINGLELSQVSENTDKRILYIVVDTNVFLSNLKTVTELLEDSGKTKSHYRPFVVVPWTVLQELDYIKDNKSRTKSVQLQKSAKSAVDMLFKYFSSKHPRLKGQTAVDAAANRKKFQVESPDDEILQSCLQIRELGCTVVLLSNDKNLCNKAIIHDISTYGRHESIQEMLSSNKYEAEPRQPKESVKSVGNQAEKVDSKEVEISDDIFCEAKAIMKNFLSIIVSKEMENLYGDNWKKYTIVQPPWSVTDVLKCTSKHWIAAIGDVFVKPGESLVKKLSEMFLNAPKYGQSLRYVNEVLDVCHDLVQTVKSKNYLELSEQTCYDIRELIDTSKRMLQEREGNRSEAFTEHENNNLNDERRANNAFKYFEEIWTYTNNFCGLAADLTGIPHCITYKNFEPALSAEAINRMQPELVFSLNQLIHALRGVLNEGDHLTTEHAALIALYQSLVNYFPNSGELNDTRSLDIFDLLCCVRVKKDVLQTGLVQLQELSCQFCRIADFRSLTAPVFH